MRSLSNHDGKGDENVNKLHQLTMETSSFARVSRAFFNLRHFTAVFFQSAT